MAFYSPTDFAKLCGKSNAYISVNRKRGKIIMSGEFIDDSLRENIDFLRKCIDGSKLEKPINEHLKERLIAISPPVYKPQESPSILRNQDYSSKYDLETTKKALEIEKLQVDTRIQLLREEKIRGEVVPIDLIKQVFITHNQSILTANKDFIDSLLLDFQAETRLSSEQSAKLRGKIVVGLNNNVNRAVDATKRNMNSIIEQHSIKKEVGERE